MVHGDTLLLSVAPSRLVISVTTIGGVTIRENPEPSTGAGKVSSPVSLRCRDRLDRAEHDGVVVDGLLGSLAGGTVMAARSRQRDPNSIDEGFARRGQL